ncbi:nuclear transport factor 2 family protein [Acidobacteria bacterium AH-259-L09]|nr:nuclear transport factor 2 family protein [Acidobacteria bacterium AH-259-L09]
MKEEPAKSLAGADLLANQELDERFVEGMSQKDIEQVMSCLWNSPDLILVDFDGNVFRGSDDVRKVFEQFFAQSESLRLVIDEISHIRAGESVFAVGTAIYKMQAKDQKAP